MKEYSKPEVKVIDLEPISLLASSVELTIDDTEEIIEGE